MTVFVTGLRLQVPPLLHMFVNGHLITALAIVVVAKVVVTGVVTVTPVAVAILQNRP